MKTDTFTVLNMACGNCEKRVQEALNDTDGVTSARVSLSDKTATVTYDESLVTPLLLKETIDDLGYELLLPEK